MTTITVASSVSLALLALTGEVIAVAAYLNVSGEVSVSKSSVSEFKAKYITDFIEDNVDMPKSCRSGRYQCTRLVF